MKILFVCHGNICRSPMCEFLLRDMVEKAGQGHRFEIASAALSREELGEPVHGPVRRLLAQQGISCSGKTARLVTKADLERFDRIYYMDSRNAQYIQRLFPDCKKCRSLLDRDVADPWYTGDYQRTWQDVQEGCRKIAEELL